MSDITECSMMILPSIAAFEDEATEYFDDYYVDVTISSVEGKMYNVVKIVVDTLKKWLRKLAHKSKSLSPRCISSSLLTQNGKCRTMCESE